MQTFWGKVKGKCTLAQALRLCTGRTAYRGSRGIALLFLDHGTRRGWGVSVTPRPLFTSRQDLVPIVQEAGWAPGPVWTGAENLAPTGIRSLDRPARSQSLYRLSYPAQLFEDVSLKRHTVERIGRNTLYTLWRNRMYTTRVQNLESWELQRCAQMLWITFFLLKIQIRRRSKKLRYQTRDDVAISNNRKPTKRSFPFQQNINWKQCSDLNNFKKYWSIFFIIYRLFWGVPSPLCI